jgi:hypothetical protein
MATLSSSFRRTAGAIASCLAGLMLLQALIFAFAQRAPASVAGVSAAAPVCAASSDRHPAPMDGRNGCASSFACCVAAQPNGFGDPLLVILAPRPRPRLAPAAPHVAEFVPSPPSRRGWSSRAPPHG